MPGPPTAGLRRGTGLLMAALKSNRDSSRGFAQRQGANASKTAFKVGSVPYRTAAAKPWLGP